MTGSATLRERRLALKIGRSEMARLVGCSDRAVSVVEANEHPLPHIRSRIIAVLECAEVEGWDRPPSSWPPCGWPEQDGTELPPDCFSGQNVAVRERPFARLDRPATVVIGRESIS